MAEPLASLPQQASAEGAPPALLHLCASTELAERGKAWVWDVLEYGRAARAFALRVDGQVVAYLNRCLHVPTELDWQPGEFFDSERRFIVCSLHGATYAPASGQCVGGPCGRGKLRPVAVQERDGAVYWQPSRDILAFEFESSESPTQAPPP